MPPESPDEIGALIDRASAEFYDAADELDQAIAELKAEQDERERDAVDPALARALHQASRNPDAPDSLRRIAARVERGQLSWSAVVDGTDDPDVADFRAKAFAVAREHYDDTGDDTGDDIERHGRRPPGLPR